MQCLDARRPERTFHFYVRIGNDPYRLEFQERGILFVKQAGDASQWLVTPTEGNPWCGCPEYYRSGYCKHSLAVEFLHTQTNFVPTQVLTK